MKTNRYLFKWITRAVVLSAIGFGIMACEDDTRTDGMSNVDTPELLQLSAEQQAVIDYLPKNVIIAHRGTEFWAPEESEIAMRWARNMGADYIEIDLQRSADKVLLALHDDNLIRTTNISVVYPNRKNDGAGFFTFDELLALDIGSWFNEANPAQARASFVGEQVLTMVDILMVAEGKRYLRARDLDPTLPHIAGIKRQMDMTDAEIAAYNSAHPDAEAFRGLDGRTVYRNDESDNGNRPGVYIETKAPYLFGGIEAELAKLLTDAGWYHDDPAKMKHIPTTPGKVGIANTKARIILQTFDGSSLANLATSFNRLLPILFLYGDIGSTPMTYANKINFAIKTGATIMGPNIDYISGYPSSVQPWQGDMIRRTGMHIHAWSFNTQEQYIKYTGPWSDPDKKGGEDKNYLDGAFTNLTDLAMNYYNNYLQPLADQGRNYFRSNANVGLPDNLHKTKPRLEARQALDQLGY